LHISIRTSATRGTDRHFVMTAACFIFFTANNPFFNS
jgi:hypothetical protein